MKEIGDMLATNCSWPDHTIIKYISWYRLKLYKKKNSSLQKISKI